MTAAAGSSHAAVAAGPSHTPLQTAQWGEQAPLEFCYEGGTPRALHIELYGQLPAAADLVGAGDLDLHEARAVGRWFGVGGRACSDICLDVVIVQHA